MDWKTQLLQNLSPDFIKLIFAILTAWLLQRLLTKDADLISYMSHVQSVTIPGQGNAPPTIIHTFVLVLWNQGKAVAKNVEIGHSYLPHHNVYPDVVRMEVATPGGGQAIQIPSIPPKTQVTITYLLINLAPNTPVVSYVNYENGPAHHVPANFSRVFPKKVLYSIALLSFAGIYLIIGWVLKLGLIAWHHL